MGGLTSGSWKCGHIPWNKGLKGIQKSSRRGKNYNLIYGELKSKKIKKQISKTSKKRTDNSQILSQLWKNKKFRNKVILSVSKANKDRKIIKETKEKLSKAAKGKNNSRYIDGRTYRWKNIRNKCFERDNYICQLCNKKNIYLNSHHIINRHICKNKFDLNNLITLCRNCHLYITNIEFTDKYDNYKIKFQKYIEKRR